MKNAKLLLATVFTLALCIQACTTPVRNENALLGVNEIFIGRFINHRIQTVVRGMDNSYFEEWDMYDFKEYREDADPKIINSIAVRNDCKILPPESAESNYYMVFADKNEFSGGAPYFEAILCAPLDETTFRQAIKANTPRPK